MVGKQAVDGDLEVTGRRTRPGVATRLAAHIEIWRLDSVFYIGLVTLSAALFAAPGGAAAGWRLACAWLAPTLGWVASLYGGDYFDRELDAITKPGRPVPSGRMSARTAFAGMVVNITAGMVLAVVLNPLNLVLVVASVVMGVLYAKVLKARGIAGNLIRGGPTFAAFVLGTLATRSLPPWPLVLLGLVFWVHDSASNLVGTICDRDGDRDGGYLTVPVRHGDTVAVAALLGLKVLWVAGAAVSPAVLPGRAGLGVFYPMLAAAVVLTALSWTMLWSAGRPIPRLRALRSHEVLVVERLILATSYLVLARGPRLAFALFVPALACTLIARFVMRQRDHPSLTGRWFRDARPVRT